MYKRGRVERRRGLECELYKREKEKEREKDDDKARARARQEDRIG